MLRLLPFFLLTPLATAAEVSFSKQVAPILVDQCVECHRAGKAKGGYRLDTVELMLKAGDSESSPVVPGKPDESELLKLIVTPEEDDRMPKKADALPEKQSALIRAWIAAGARLDVTDPKATLASILPQEKIASPEIYPKPLPVTALALSPDGRTLACSGYFEVTLWDVTTGKLTSRISGLPERVLGLAWPVPNQLAVGGGVPGRSGELWTINPANPSERKRLATSRDCILSLAASSDGKILAAGGADNILRCFDLPATKLKWQIEPHADWITAVAVSSDGTRIATTSRDRTARRIDSANGEIEATFTAHPCAILSVAFTPDGKEIISGDVEGEIRRWDHNGEGKKDTTLHPAGRTEITALAFVNADTPVLATGSGAVTSMDSPKRQVKDKITRYDDRVNVLLVTRVGEAVRIISGCHDGKVRIHEPGKPDPLIQFIASPGW